jgi:hypothetical protein
MYQLVSYALGKFITNSSTYFSKFIGKATSTSSLVELNFLLNILWSPPEKWLKEQVS